MTEKRFTVIYDEHSKMNQYVDNQKEEPNRWAIWNASETAQKLNKLNDENEQLKKELHISNECETISIENSLRLSDEILDLQKKCSELTDTLTAQVEKNIDLSMEVNQLRIENMRLKELQK